jgi:hypothetical protein
MVREQAIEQDFVPILQRGQEDVAFQVIVLVKIVALGARELFLHRGDMGWEQSDQTKRLPLLFGKGAPFVQQRLVEEQVAPGRNLQHLLVGYILVAMRCHVTPCPFSDNTPGEMARARTLRTTSGLSCKRLEWE